MILNPKAHHRNRQEADQIAIIIQTGIEFVISDYIVFIVDQVIIFIFIFAIFRVVIKIGLVVDRRLINHLYHVANLHLSLNA